MLGGARKGWTATWLRGTKASENRSLNCIYNYQDKGEATWLWAEIAKRGSGTATGLLAVVSAGDGRMRWPVVRGVRRLGDGWAEDKKMDRASSPCFNIGLASIYILVLVLLFFKFIEKLLNKIYNK